MTHPLPPNWQSDTLSNFQISVIDGDRGKNYPKQSEFQEAGYCVFLNAGNVTKSGFNFSEVQFISQERDELLRKGKLKKGDLVITTRGTTGNTAYYSDEIPFEHIRINSGMAILRNTNGNILTPYLVHFLKSSAFVREIERLSFGSAQPQLTIKLIDKISPPLPPLPEQHRIVAVLETWDKAIEKLEQKIALKKNVKKGLIQQLLTGKKRLPGFSGKWKEVKLGDVFDLKKGNGLSKEKVVENGNYKCLLYGEIYTTYKEVAFNIKGRTNSKEGVESHEGDILVPASTTTSALDLATATTINEGGVLLGGDINILRSKKSNLVNNVFMAYQLNHTKKHELARLAQGITIVHLYGKDFKKIKIAVPTIEEQNTISEILISAEQEIEFLQSKLQKLKDQKTHLLNHLITGRIRTPENMPIPTS